MNDDELQSLLRNTPAPDLGPEDWDAFAKRVVLQAGRRPRVEPPAPEQWFLPVASGAVLAVLLIFVGFVIGRAQQRLSSADYAALAHPSPSRLAALRSPFNVVISDDHGLAALVTDCP
jgi:hypothetical protein